MLLFFNSSFSINRSSGSALWPGVLLLLLSLGAFAVIVLLGCFLIVLFCWLGVFFFSQVEAEALASLVPIVMI